MPPNKHAMNAMEIDRLMPGLIVEELRQDGHQAADVSEKCHRLVHEAWRSGAGARA